MLENKVAIVVGGSGAVGSTIARKLAAAGASVVLSARAEEQLRATADAIRADSGRAEYVVADATDATAVAALFDEVVQRNGGVDIVVNAISSDAGEQGVRCSRCPRTSSWRRWTFACVRHTCWLERPRSRWPRGAVSC